MPIFTCDIPMVVNNHSTMQDISAQNIDLSGTLDVSNKSTFSTITASGLAIFNNGITTNNITVSNEFLVNDKFSIENSGNTSIGGTIVVDRLATFQSGINADNFSVAQGTGNVGIGGDSTSSDQLKVYDKWCINGNLNVKDNVTIEGTLNVQNSNYSYVKTTINSINLDVCDNIIKINVKDILTNQTTNLPSGIMVQDVSKNVFFGYSGRKEGQEHSDKWIITKTDYDEESQSDISLSYDKPIDVFMNGSLDVSGTISGFGIIPIGGIIMWNGSTIPNGWAICDGTTVNGYGKVPDLRGKFILGLTNHFPIDNSGGSFQITLDNLPPHNHNASANSAPQHTHSGTTQETNINHDHTINVANSDPNDQNEPTNHDHPDLESSDNSTPGSTTKKKFSSGTSTFYDLTTDVDKTKKSTLHNHTASITTNTNNHNHTATCTQTNPIHNHTFTTSQSGAYTPTISVSQTGSGTDYLQPYYVLAYIIRVI